MLRPMTRGSLLTSVVAMTNSAELPTRPGMSTTGLPPGFGIRCSSTMYPSYVATGPLENEVDNKFVLLCHQCAEEV
ncbi:hypothetical protein TYRP_013464 [Tyrophagus putrescentiae]|nr:hypothetical protein TYRP_013464 [Tyrophagus putrescentiae]